MQCCKTCCGSGESVPSFQYLAMFTGTLNIMCSGMHFGWLSPTLPILLGENSPIPITAEEGTWLAVVLPIGTICGALLGGTIMDRIGRKTVILLASGPFFIAWITLGCANSVSVLAIARFIAGISDGLIFCGIPSYLGEIADSNIRGFLGSAIMVAWIFGCLIMDILGSYLTVSNAAFVASTIPILTLVTFYWMPESPYYLIMKHKFHEAQQSLVVFKGSQDVGEKFEMLVQAVDEQNRNTGKYWDLFAVESNRKSLFILLGSVGAQQLTGVVAITFYAQIIFEEAGNGLTPTSCSHIYFATQILLSGISAVIVDKTGRKPLMIISIIGSGCALFTIGSYFYIINHNSVFDDISTSSGSYLIPIIAMIIFVISYNIGLQTIPIVLLGEIFPTNVKAFANILYNVYLASIIIITTICFQISKDQFGMYVPFFMFGGCCILGLLFIIFYVPETKGKTLEEIYKEIKGKKSDRRTTEVSRKANDYRLLTINNSK